MSKNPYMSFSQNFAAKKLEEFEVLHEDDEFEEFEDDWTHQDEGDKVQLWDDTWDDEDITDDFSKQLRAELANQT